MMVRKNILLAAIIAAITFIAPIPTLASNVESSTSAQNTITENIESEEGLSDDIDNIDVDDDSTSRDAKTDNKEEISTKSTKKEEKWFQFSFKNFLTQILVGVVIFVIPGCYIFYKSKK